MYAGHHPGISFAISTSELRFFLQLLIPERLPLQCKKQTLIRQLRPVFDLPRRITISLTHNSPQFPLRPLRSDSGLALCCRDRPRHPRGDNSDLKETGSRQTGSRQTGSRQTGSSRRDRSGSHCDSNTARPIKNARAPIKRGTGMNRTENGTCFRVRLESGQSLALGSDPHQARHPRSSARQCLCVDERDPTGQYHGQLSRREPPAPSGGCAAGG